MQSAAAPAQAFTGKEFRAAVGSFATGVTVVTTRGEDHDYGMTANAFTSVSLDPPLVLVCAIAGTDGSEHIRSNGVYAVNVLGAEQEPLSRYFSSKERPKGRDAFRDVPHRVEVSGSPILDGVAGFFDCRLHEAHEAGDHELFIGEVLALGVDSEVEPLMFFGGGYRFLGPA